MDTVAEYEYVKDIVARLFSEAQANNHRRLLVLSGCAQSLGDALLPALDSVGLFPCPVVSDRSFPAFRGYEKAIISPSNARRALLGKTQRSVVCDLYSNPDPDLLGVVSGVVKGGGILILLIPSVEQWWHKAMTYREGLSPPPFSDRQVSSHLLERIWASFANRPQVVTVDLSSQEPKQLAGGDEPTHPHPYLHPHPHPHLEHGLKTVPIQSGICDSAEPSGGREGRLGLPNIWVITEEPRRAESRTETAAQWAIAGCLTEDQKRAVGGLLDLAASNKPAAMVIESDRGRGKSGALGLAAGALIAKPSPSPLEIVVTSLSPGGLEPVLSLACVGSQDLRSCSDVRWGAQLSGPGGRLRFLAPLEAVQAKPDLLLVDEAATLDVKTLENLLACAKRVAFATTTHGYEGTGMGFTVRFLERLRVAERALVELHLETPVRWAPGDPVEAWSRCALLLDASPAPSEEVAQCTCGAAELDYRHPSSAELAADDAYLRQTFGLLLLAHYRTRPSDLAIMLDSPAIRVRTLSCGRHVVAAALLDLEGGLPPDLADRSHFASGGRLRGNLLPETLISHLRMGPQVAALRAVRVVRIAVHPAIRNRGLGTRLLDLVAQEGHDLGVDYLGTAFGATANLCRFWRNAGFRVVRLGTRRGATSGERSAVLLRGVSPQGQEVASEAQRRFVKIVGDQLRDHLRDLDPEIVWAAAGNSDDSGEGEKLDLEPWEWEALVALCAGAQTHDALVRPMHHLVLHHLKQKGPSTNGARELTAKERHLLVAKVLQGRRWLETANLYTSGSIPEVMRQFRQAMRPLVFAHGGPEVAQSLRAFEEARETLQKQG